MLQRTTRPSRSRSNLVMRSASCLLGSTSGAPGEHVEQNLVGRHHAAGGDQHWLPLLLQCPGKRWNVRQSQTFWEGAEGIELNLRAVHTGNMHTYYMLVKPVFPGATEVPALIPRKRKK